MISFGGIIAAGAGSRMQRANVKILKPLVEVRGKPLVHWVAAGLRQARIRRLVMLLNSSGGPVRDYLTRNFGDLSWTFLSKDTASSWESFRIVAKRLAREADRFLISTVDALVPPMDTMRFAREALALKGDHSPAAGLALTRFVEDEKPVWADVNEMGVITALGDNARRREAVTCGLYALTRQTAEDLPPKTSHARLRDFWRNLVRSGKPVNGILLGSTVDVDRPKDLAAAERTTLCFDA